MVARRPTGKRAPVAMTQAEVDVLTGAVAVGAAKLANAVHRRFPASAGAAKGPAARGARVASPGPINLRELIALREARPPSKLARRLFQEARAAKRTSAGGPGPKGIPDRTPPQAR